MSDKKYIVAIGLRGFPYGTAPIQKLKMMGRAIVDEGHEFLVISNEYIRKSNLNSRLKKKGEIDGVHYQTTSPSVFSPKSPLKKIQYKIIGKFRELFFLFSLKRKGELDAVIVYCNKFIYTSLWGFLLNILRVPCFLIYFELRSTVSNRTKWHLRLNDKLYDRFIFYFYNGFFVISDLLISHLKKYVRHKKYLNIPPIVDFDYYGLPLEKPSNSYFLFCGSLAYFEVIKFIIESYKRVQSSETKLYLVVSGSKEAKSKLNQLISSHRLEEKVELFSNVSDEQLKDLYKNANALLIPLRNTSQDIARFPHKIAEYCASGRPIVSTKLGEVANYFNNSNAFLANNFDVEQYADKLQYILDHPEEAEIVAKNGYKLGKEMFNYKVYSKPILSLIYNKS